MSYNGFFDAFPDFEPDPDAPPSGEFNRLARQRNWKINSKTWRKNWSRFINMEYDRLLGDNGMKGLDDWRSLCEELDLPGPFTSVNQCKRALSKVYVNIADFLDSRQLSTKPAKFRNLKALSEYTRRTGKFFHRDLVKQDKLLRVLLKRLA